MNAPLYQQKPEHFEPIRTTCGLCNSPNIYKYHQDFRGNQIYRCRDCNIQFQNPQYNQAYLDDYYSGYIIPRPEYEKLHVLTDRYKLKYLHRYTGKPGRLLDVGCGNGHLLKAAKAAGWDVTGYDVDPENTRKVSAELAVPIIHGQLQGIVEHASAHGQFDAIVLNQVLEHVKDPHEYFAMFEQVLKDGGHLMLAVPNINAFAARFKRFLEKVGIRKRKVGNYYDTDHHIWYYTRSSLTFLLKKYGYTPKCFRGDLTARRLRTPMQRLKSRLLAVFRIFLWESTFLVVSRKTR